MDKVLYIKDKIIIQLLADSREHKIELTPKLSVYLDILHKTMREVENEN